MTHLFVTRHTALAVVLAEDYGIRGEVVAHVTPDQVRGREVVGVLPLHLAAEASSVTELQLELPAALRGVELTASQVRTCARGLVTYEVQRVASCPPCYLRAFIAAEAAIYEATDPQAGPVGLGIARRQFAWASEHAGAEPAAFGRLQLKMAELENAHARRPVEAFEAAKAAYRAAKAAGVEIIPTPAGTDPVTGGSSCVCGRLLSAQTDSDNCGICGGR